MLNIPKYYEDPTTLHVGCEEPHAYFIPYLNGENALTKSREESKYFQLLNGEWDFRFYNTIIDVEDGFYTADYEINGNYDKIKVPMNWQMALRTTPIRTTHIPAIRRMSPTTTRAEFISVTLILMRTTFHVTFFSTLRVSIPAFIFG